MRCRALVSLVTTMAGGFEALGLAPELVRAVTEDLGYLLPTNVQVCICIAYIQPETMQHRRQQQGPLSPCTVSLLLVLNLKQKTAL